MIFSECAEWVIADMRPDGDSFIPAPAAAPYFSSPWGQRLAAYLSNFTFDTYLLYTSKQAIIVDTGDREFSFADSSNCDLHFFEVEKVFVDNYPLNRVQRVADLLRDWTPAVAAGTPQAWAQLDKSRIVFDVEVAETLSDTYVAGYYRHPAITADTDVIQVQAEDIELFSRYAQCLMREKVVADEVGFTRLNRLDAQTAKAIKQMKSERFAMMISGCR